MDGGWIKKIDGWLVGWMDEEKKYMKKWMVGQIKIDGWLDGQKKRWMVGWIKNI